MTCIPVTGDVRSWFSTSVKNVEPRTLAQEEVYLACKVKVHSKRSFDWAAQKAALTF